MFSKYAIPYAMDDPRTTLSHREIIKNKPFLRRIYSEWYQLFIRTATSGPPGSYLEIGSGGGFLQEVFPEVITSDILSLPHIDRVFSAEEMPFGDQSLACIMMLNVFHHIPKPYLFLEEAQRTLKENGKIIMIEPAHSIWSRFIYQTFHHEPFDPTGPREIKAGNPLSHSNQALPYIYFERDLELFSSAFPLLRIKSIEYHSPLIYLFSGGVSRPALLPYFMYGGIRFMERLLYPLRKQLGMFCTIILEKKAT
jgi:SAM-dependent methyltransferase